MPKRVHHNRRQLVARNLGWLVRVGCLVLVFTSSGCKLGGLTGKDKQYDLLEAELRTREREIQELRGEVQQQRLLNQTYQRQLPMYASDPIAVGHGGQTPNVPTLPLKEITLGAGTGGVNDDNLPGDESLMVAIIPKDDDGTAIKVPGQAVVSAFEINRQGIKTQIGQWNVSADQLRRAWKSGLLSTGYFVPLQWDRLPTTEKLRLSVRFQSNDGQSFEADKDVTIRPLPPRNTPTALPPQNVPTEELPPPAARFKLRK
jgi:hypothetical protein